MAEELLIRASLCIRELKKKHFSSIFPALEVAADGIMVNCVSPGRITYSTDDENPNSRRAAGNG
jgi:hypothetical protein